MTKEIQQVLISKEQIKDKVLQLAAKISQDYHGEQLVIIGVLKGSVMFFADLARAIKQVDIRFDFIAVSSYGNSAQTTGAVRILKDLDLSIENKHVLIVEDIVDTGLTLSYLQSNLQARGPASLNICALLDKPSRRKVEITPKYIGFTIDDHFVVGYGLDYSERYRYLEDICVLCKEVYTK